MHAGPRGQIEAPYRTRGVGGVERCAIGRERHSDRSSQGRVLRHRLLDGAACGIVNPGDGAIARDRRIVAAGCKSHRGGLAIGHQGNAAATGDRNQPQPVSRGQQQPGAIVAHRQTAPAGLAIRRQRHAAGQRRAGRQPRDHLHAIACDQRRRRARRAEDHPFGRRDRTLGRHFGCAMAAQGNPMGGAVGRNQHGQILARRHKTSLQRVRNRQQIAQRGCARHAANRPQSRGRPVVHVAGHGAAQLPWLRRGRSAQQ